MYELIEPYLCEPDVVILIQNCYCHAHFIFHIHSGNEPLAVNCSKWRCKVCHCICSCFALGVGEGSGTLRDARVACLAGGILLYAWSNHKAKLWWQSWQVPRLLRSEWQSHKISHSPHGFATCKDGSAYKILPHARTILPAMQANPRAESWTKGNSK